LPGRFVGVGIDQYEVLDPLEFACAEVRGVAERLEPWFSVDLWCDADRVDSGVIRDGLASLREGSRPDSLILVWAGHGEVEGSQLLLRTRDQHGELDVNEIVRRCVRSGAPQLLIVIDTCYAGAGVDDAASVAAAIRAEQAQQADERVWFGILVSCGTLQTAKDGVFSKLLLKLLTDGPDERDAQRRWSRHNRLIFGDDLGTALLEEWPDAEEQRPDFLYRGQRWFLIPNPLWEPNAPEVVVEHLLRAARSGGSEADRSWFTGRSAEVDEVVSWVRARRPGVCVVTGSAGTGKSAIVGRVVSLSNPFERNRLDNEGGWAWHSDPGPRSVQAHLHARGLTADQAAELLDAQLTRQAPADLADLAGEASDMRSVDAATGRGDVVEAVAVLPPAEQGRRNASELVGALQRSHEDGRPPPVIVVDGLDEARDQAFMIAQDLLVRLARFATVIVSTRPITRDVVPSSIVAVLAPVVELDLDSEAQRCSQLTAMQGYLETRLTEISAEMDPGMVAEDFVARAGAEHESFLLARIVADQLAADPIDTSAPNWQTQLNRSIQAAFDTDVARVTANGWAVPEAVTAPALARLMLEALTWAYGGGFPEDEWLAVAAASSGQRLTRDHVSWVLDQLGRYVIQDGEAGVAVYRLAHQSLADHLRRPFQASHDRPFDPEALPVFDALATRYRNLLDDGYSVDTPTYLWRYAHRHAAAAGPPGLDYLRDLATGHPGLRPDVADAELAIADVLGHWGNQFDAVTLAEEAVDIFQGLVADSPGHLPRLGAALSNLGVYYGEAGQFAEAVDTSEKAIGVFRALALSNPAYRIDLAMALDNLGVHHSLLDRPGDAIFPSREAITIFGELAADNPAYRIDLAMALDNFGNSLTGLGRHSEAVAPTEEAVRVFRALAEEYEALRPNLAMALDNLGTRYNGVGRHGEAVASTEEAVKIYRELAAANPAHRLKFAGALCNLGTRYRAVGRQAEAVALTEQAVTVLRGPTTDNPARRLTLARVLANLGPRYREVGQHAEAVACLEESVSLFQALAADSPEHWSSLADALSSLGVHYSEAGQPAAAIAPAQEAAGIHRALAADNPEHRSRLADALSNLGVHYGKAGQRGAAVTSIEGAVDVYRALAADNPEHRLGLADALSNLGLYYGEAGQRGAAVTSIEEAVDVYRALAADNPEHRSRLANALSNLGVSYSEQGQPAKALPPTLEAVNLYRELAVGDPFHRPGLARALDNLGIRYLWLDRHAEAVAATDEAVNVFRELAANDPAQRPNLADALTQLGFRYFTAGRNAEAMAPTEEAVGLYRQLAAANSAFRPRIAATLDLLDRLQRDADDPSGADVRWDEVLNEQPDPVGRAELLILRSIGAPVGDRRAVAWLIDALEQAPALNRGALAAAHEAARTHRGSNAVAWDAAWVHISGEPVPGWMTADVGLVATARDWIATPNYRTERDYLAAHHELLEVSADAAFEEALLAAPEQAGDHYRSRRAAARVDGIAAAYRAMLAYEISGEFCRATPQRQREMLNDHRVELTSDDVRSVLADAAKDHAVPALMRAQALLTLAAKDPTREILDDVFDAIEHPDRLAELLHHIARRTNAVATLLGPVAQIAFDLADSTDAVGLAELYSAVAEAIAGHPDTAVSRIRHAADIAPAQRSGWIALLAQIGATHPTVLPLIPVLTESPAL
jgi:tetratricopeptide (TPR) repeat protein